MKRKTRSKATEEIFAAVGATEKLVRSFEEELRYFKKCNAARRAEDSGGRRFAIFIDYRNLEKGLEAQNRQERLSDFSWLTGPVLAEGKIIFAFVFIPEHYLSRAPIMQLAYRHRFQIVVCPRQIGTLTTKDADSVDEKIRALAEPIVEHSDITDIVIVSGDADFEPLAVTSVWRQKRVKIVSASDAVSGRFVERAVNGSLTISLVP